MDIEELEQFISTHDGVMLYFSGENCGVCDALKPKIKEVIETNFPKIEQVYIKTQENIEIASQVGVFSVPTIIIYLDGKEFLREGRNISLLEFAAKLSRPYNMMFS
ncbi:MAG: thioredoxin family protein [Sulfurovaceae bacterium]|nr:thioredoxin family protein [Sulfurovaceae bacterium]MDD5549515.1 thioredoxin family protein [Sulfurovaceae bacterium]